MSPNSLEIAIFDKRILLAIYQGFYVYKADNKHSKGKGRLEIIAGVKGGGVNRRINILTRNYVSYRW